MLEEQKENLLNKLNKILKFCEDNGMENVASKFRHTIDYFDNDTLNVIILGEVKRGKSSFINALIGRNLLPIGPTPTTATINILKYSKNEEIVVCYLNGKTEKLELTENSLNKFTASSEFKSDDIKYVEVYIDHPMLKNKAVIIDTPGVNDICETRSEITYGFLPLVDLAIFVLDSTQPLSKSESEFIKTQFIKKSQSKVLFTLGKIDRINHDEIKDSIECCNERLSKIIKVDKGDVIIPFSSKLHSKDKNDSNSGIEQLRSKIDEYISKTNRNQRRIDLLNATLKNFIEAVDNEIGVHENIMKMSVDEKNKAIEEIKSNINGKNSNFENFKKYMELVRSKVIAGITKSFETFSNDLVQSLAHMIDTYSGNPKELVEKHLPYQIKISLKKWVEHHQPALQSGLNHIASQLIGQYQKNLGQTKLLKAMLVSIDSGKELDFGQMEACDTNAMKKNMMLTAGVVGLAGMMLIGPLSMPIAMLYSNFIGSQEIENKANEVKRELINKLPSNVSSCLSAYKKSTFNNVDRFFENVENFFKENFDSIFIEFKKKISDNNVQIDEIKNKFESLRQNFKEVSSDKGGS